MQWAFITKSLIHIPFVTQNDDILYFIYVPAQHLECVFERGLRLRGDVSLDVVLHGDAAEGDGQDAGHVEDLGVEVRHVRHHEDEQGFQDARVVREPSHEPCHVTPDCG